MKFRQSMCTHDDTLEKFLRVTDGAYAALLFSDGHVDVAVFIPAGQRVLILIPHTHAETDFLDVADVLNARKVGKLMKDKLIDALGARQNADGGAIAVMVNIPAVTEGIAELHINFLSALILAQAPDVQPTAVAETDADERNADILILI